MADIEIVIFVTQDLADASELSTGDEFYAARVAQTYIEGALDKNSYSHYVFKDTANFPNPPKEAPGASVCEPNGICGNDSDGKCYNTLTGWWTDWWKNMSCKDPHGEADDLYLLLTYATGGGLAFPRSATCGAANLLNISDPNRYNHFGFADGNGTWNQVDSVLEEVGHALIENMSDEDGDGSSHDSGMIKKDSNSGKYGISPIGIKDTINFDGLQTNNCSTPYDKFKADNDNDGDIDGWVYEYSPCSENHFVT